MRYSPLTLFLFLLLNTTTVFSQTYYVKISGDDSAAGTSHATAWKTISKVNSFTFNTSDDVYFFGGDHWKNKQLLIDWLGTDDDRVTIGTYYIENGVTKSCTSTKCPSKAIIAGGYVNTSNIGSVPATPYEGVIMSRADYVTIQNLVVRDSSGYGIVLGGTYKETESRYNIVENNEVIHLTGAGIYGYRGSDYAIARNNIVTQCVWSDFDNINPYHSHPSCIEFPTTKHVLIEGNTLYDNFGEGIALNIGATYGVVRHNLITNGQYLGIYINGSSYNLIENNMILGGGPKPSAGIAVSIEINSKNYNAVENIIRNNLISGVTECFYSGLFKEAVDNGRVTGGRFIGNTCVGVDDTVLFFKKANSYSTWEISNNIFWDVNNGNLSCGTPTDIDINFHHNSWGTKPNNSNCDGVGDIYGNPNLQSSSDFRLYNYRNMPTASDFEPQPGSIVENAAVYFNASIFSETTNPNFKNFQSGTCQADNKKLTFDYNCALRKTNQSSMGAIEVGATKQETITFNPINVPFYMNIGSANDTISKQTFIQEIHRDMSTDLSVYYDSSSTSVNNTSLSEIYQTWIGCNCDLVWNFPIENNKYTIVLMFSEQYWGNKAQTCTGGERRFDITINGTLIADEYDLCKEAKGANIAVEYTHNVNVSDNMLNIKLSPGSTNALDNKPEIAGIKIVRVNPPAKINIQGTLIY